MQIVIEIDEKIYKASQIIDVKYEDVIQIPLEVIANGTPLPEHHGDLKDVDSFDYLCRYIDGDCIGNCYTCNDRVVSSREIQDSPTIIPATGNEFFNFDAPIIKKQTAIKEGAE